MPRVLSIHVFGKIIIEDNAGKILLLQRSLRAHGKSFTWDFPGGTMENEEALPDLIARELREETGITADVSDAELFYAESFKVQVNRLVLVYRIRLLQRPHVKLSLEHTRYEWVSPEDAESRNYGPWGKYMNNALAQYRRKYLTSRRF